MDRGASSSNRLPGAKHDRESWAFRHRGWFGIVVLVPLGVITLLSQPMVAEGGWLDVAIEALGWPLFVAGAAFRFWSTLYIGGHKRSTLVCEGPYSICRNPLYVGSFMLGGAAGMFLQSLTFTAGVALTAIGYMIATVPAEERFLGDSFGKAYLDYCDRVPRYWPRFDRLRTEKRIQVDIGALRTECAKALGWIWIPILGELIADLRTQPWWPRLFHLP